jgi:hypothetical protein
MERIEPIGRDRTVQRVELARLSPVEREREKQRRGRRRREQPMRPQNPPRAGGSGLDVRV